MPPWAWTPRLAHTWGTASHPGEGEGEGGGQFEGEGECDSVDEGEGEIMRVCEAVRVRP